MRIVVEHPLNTHFVEVQPNKTIHEVFELKGVGVAVDVAVPEGGSFATIVCSGILETDSESVVTTPPESLGTETVLLRGRFIAHGALTRNGQVALDHALSRIEEVLDEVAEVLMWRFNLPGRDPVFAGTSVQVTDVEENIEVHTLPRIVPGDNNAHLTDAGLNALALMLQTMGDVPLAHQLLREAWNLHWTSLRSALVIGVAAAEVGMKQHIVHLLPDTQWLVEEMPSPPLDKMMSDFLPSLPTYTDIDSSRRCPKYLRKVIKAAVEDRNRVSHRGASPAVHVRATLESIREFLYLLDFYKGHEWARTHLSARTLLELGIQQFPLDSSK